MLSTYYQHSETRIAYSSNDRVRDLRRGIGRKGRSQRLGRGLRCAADWVLEKHTVTVALLLKRILCRGSYSVLKARFLLRAVDVVINVLLFIL